MGMQSDLKELKSELEFSKKFEKKWHELGSVIRDSMDTGQCSPSTEQKFQELKRWLSINFPKTGMSERLLFERIDPLLGTREKDVDCIAAFLMETDTLEKILNPGLFSRGIDSLGQWNEIARFIPLHIGHLEKAIQDLELRVTKKDSQAGITGFDQLCHYLNTKLRMCFDNPPRSEKEVQTEVRKLLVARDYIVHKEKHSIPHSAKYVVPDFVIEELNAALEVKFTDSKPKRQAVIDEISADIQSYLTKFRNILFVIYDIGTIRDALEFRRGLEVENVKVIIVKH